MGALSAEFTGIAAILHYVSADLQRQSRAAGRLVDVRLPSLVEESEEVRVSSLTGKFTVREIEIFYNKFFTIFSLNTKH